MLCCNNNHYNLLYIKRSRINCNNVWRRIFNLHLHLKLKLNFTSIVSINLLKSLLYANFIKLVFKFSKSNFSNTFQKINIIKL